MCSSDLKSIYLQQNFSAPVLFLGGLLFGYGMVLSNGCGSRALVLLGRGNLRSLVVVIILAIFAQMTLKGLIAPSRIAMVGASQTTAATNSLPALLASLGLSAVAGRMIAASVLAAALAGDVQRGLFFRGANALPFGAAIRSVRELIDYLLYGLMPADLQAGAAG